MAADGGASEAGHVAPGFDAAAHAEMHFADSADWLEEAVFGSLDGVITSLALVVTLNIVLSETSHTVFLTVIGASVAGTISMFVGALLSARSRENLRKRERAREEWEVDHIPEIERQEIEEIYRKQGFSESEVRLLADRICSDRKLWVDVMMRDELGLPAEESTRSTRHAGIIGFSYLLGGGLLALPFLFSSGPTRTVLGHTLGIEFFTSLGLGALVLAIVGVVEARFSGAHPVRSVAEIVAIGLAAAIAVFLVTTALTPA